MSEVLEKDNTEKILEKFKSDIVYALSEDIYEVINHNNKIVSLERKERKQESKELRKNLSNSIKAIDKSHSKLKTEIADFNTGKKLFEKSLLKSLDDNYKATIQIARKTAESIQLMNNKIESFTEVLEEKNKELESYRDGYELSLNKKAYMQLIRLIRDAENNSENLTDGEKFIFCLKQLKNILMDIGVEEFAPQVGDPIDRRYMTISCQIETNNEELSDTVKVVLETGYCVHLSDVNKKILETCTVEAYKYIGKEEE